MRQYLSKYFYILNRKYANLKLSRSSERDENIVSRRLSSLDGLRGLAAILVFLAHVSGRNLSLIQWLDFSKSGLGKSGVYLFFVLSSFLLTSQFLKPKIKLGSWKLWIIYLKKRLVRIYPLYVVVLLGYLLLWGYPSDKFFRHLFLIEGESCFWTIVVEVKYYFILPAIVYVIIRLINKNLWLFGAFLFAVYLIDGLIWWRLGTVMTISLIPYLPTFLIGAGAALVNAKMAELPQIDNDKFKWLCDALAIIAIVTIFWMIWFVKDDRAEGANLPFELFRFNIPVVYGIVWAIFLVCHLWGKGLVKSILNYPLLRFIGTIGFGFYLWHIPVLGYLDAHLVLPSALKFMVIFVVTTGVASVTYFSIEKPFMQLGSQKL